MLPCPLVGQHGAAPGDSKTDVRTSQLFFRATLGGKPDPCRDWQASEAEGLCHPLLFRPVDAQQFGFVCPVADTVTHFLLD